MDQQQKTTSLAEELQRAIAASGMSLNQIGKASGVSQAQLSRFMRGARTLTLPAADRLCGFFNLRLTRVPRSDVEGSEEGGAS
jgi:transcriptional regulator with XRE-family HTH domain